MIYHAVESPTGLIHVAPTRSRTRCGKEVDLDKWVDLGALKPLETPTAFLHRIDSASVCDRCIPRKRKD